jgi:hypothetical protein
MTAAAEYSSTIVHAAAVCANELGVPDVIDDAHISRTRASMMAQAGRRGSCAGLLVRRWATGSVLGCHHTRLT